MSSISMKRIHRALALIPKLARKADDGDEVLTKRELDRLTRKEPKMRRPQLDAVTGEVLRAGVAVTKNIGDRSVDGFPLVVAKMKPEILEANKDGAAVLDDKAQKRVKSRFGRAVLAFARQHGLKTLAAFKIVPSTAELWLPKKAFSVSASATPDAVLDALLRHFNGRANDNRESSVNITRYVIGDAEAKGMVAAIAKLPKSRAKAVLRALRARIQTNAYGMDPKPVYLPSRAEKRVTALAKKLGVGGSFHGNPQAPKYNYY